MQSSPNDVAIAISSFDGYKHAWPPFCHGLNKYWPNPPWPVYIVTNYLDPLCMQALKVGKNRGWTHATRTALQAIDASVVLWVHEDAWLAAPPDTPAIRDWAGLIIQGKADYVRLCIGRKELWTEVYPDDPRLLVVPPRYRYRVSLGPSLWSVEKFLSLLKDGESAWDFEVKGSKRAWSDDKRFLCYNGHAWEYPTLNNPNWRGCREPIRRRRWTEGAREYAKREGIEIDWGSNPHG